MRVNHTPEERHCSKIDIKDTIRRVLGERIVALCKATGRSIKAKIATLSVPLLVLALATDHTQSQLESFSGSGNPETGVHNRDNQKTSEESDSEGSQTSEDKSRGLIYARVSSGDQLNSEEDSENEEFDQGSIKGQIDELTELASEEGIELPYDPITDEAETGTNFDREGIQEVFEISKNKETDYLLVEKVDRIGRNAPETLYFIYVLQSECNVTLLTPSGERDIEQVEGLMHTTLLSLMAEVQNNIRTTKAKKERIRGFLHRKNWKHAYPKIPLGYDETDDGWLKINPEEKKIVRDLFRKFVDCGTYEETEEYINQKYGSHILDGHQVKTLLTNSVHIGEPRLPEAWITETTYENDIEDPSLNILQKDPTAEIDISEDIFREAQEMIRKKDKKGSSDDDTHQLLDFIEEYSLFAVIEGSKPATLLHHCGEPMIKDGQRNLKGRTVHRYRCRKCEESENAESYYRQWPHQYELDKIELIHRVTDGNSELFDES